MSSLFSPGTWGVRKGHWRHSWFIVIQKLEERRNRPELVKAYHEPRNIRDVDGKPALAIASLDALQMDPSKSSAQNLLEAEANAYLFAASKDLYEALNGFYHHHQMVAYADGRAGGCGCENCAAATKALVKAEKGPA